MGRYGRTLLGALAALLLSASGGETAHAVKIWVKDGRIMEGKKVKMKSIVEIKRA